MAPQTDAPGGGGSSGVRPAEESILPSSPMRLMSGLRLESPTPWPLDPPVPRGRSSLVGSTLVGQRLVDLPERYDQLASDLNEKFVAAYGAVPDEPALCLVTGMPPHDDL